MIVDPADEIIIRREGRVGRVTLNRPDALNALTHGMALALEKTLHAWSSDPDIDVVLIDANGNKAFCAGGDITSLYRKGMQADFESSRQFWRDEYRLNALIKRYPKPYIAIMDGIVMGGGVGISAHGSMRIVTEHSIIAMPECSIGLIPDVGASHLLAQAPGFVGEYLSMTGMRMKAGDALFAGFADHYVASDRLPELKKALIETGNVDAIKDFKEAAPESCLKRLQTKIDTVFKLVCVGDIVNTLKVSQEEWCAEAYAKITNASPLSIKATCLAIRYSRQLPGLEHALKIEYRFVSRVMEPGDFLEGIRAAIIDKDRHPKWLHDDIASVPDDLLATMLSRVESGDLKFEQSERS